MSDYPDDSDYRDPINPDRVDRDPRADEESIRAAKRAVSVPVIGLIVIGVLTLLSAFGGLIQMATIGQEIDDAIKEIRADPNIPAQQKQEQVELITKIRDIILAYGTPFYVASAVVGVIILIGALRLKSLANPGLVLISALASMLPLSACCLLGAVFGIWAIVVLRNPVVQAGFAARRRARHEPDAY